VCNDAPSILPRRAGVNRQRSIHPWLRTNCRFPIAANGGTAPHSRPRKGSGTDPNPQPANLAPCRIQPLGGLVGFNAAVRRSMRAQFNDFDDMRSFPFRRLTPTSIPLH